MQYYFAKKGRKKVLQDREIGILEVCLDTIILVFVICTFWFFTPLVYINNKFRFKCSR